MSAVKIVLEARARRHPVAPWTWQAILVCPLRRWRGRPAWIGRSRYFAEEVALAGAKAELERLERQTWMGEH